MIDNQSLLGWRQQQAKLQVQLAPLQYELPRLSPQDRDCFSKTMRKSKFYTRAWTFFHYYKTLLARLGLEPADRLDSGQQEHGRAHQFNPSCITHILFPLLEAKFIPSINNNHLSPWLARALAITNWLQKAGCLAFSFNDYFPLQIECPFSSVSKFCCRKIQLLLTQKKKKARRPSFLLHYFWLKSWWIRSASRQGPLKTSSSPGSITVDPCGEIHLLPRRIREIVISSMKSQSISIRPV